MAARLKIRDREFNAALAKMTGEGLARAVQHYHTQLRLAVNKPNSGVKQGAKRGEGGRFLKQKTTYPNPSKPGEPPRKRTGFGQNSIVREIDKKAMIARVGVTKAGIYMAYLDLGTKHIARRPFFEPVLRDNLQVMAALLKSGRSNP